MRYWQFRTVFCTIDTYFKSIWGTDQGLGVLSLSTIEWPLLSTNQARTPVACSPTRPLEKDVNNIFFDSVSRYLFIFSFIRLIRLNYVEAPFQQLLGFCRGRSSHQSHSCLMQEQPGWRKIRSCLFATTKRNCQCGGGGAVARNEVRGGSREVERALSSKTGQGWTHHASHQHAMQPRSWHTWCARLQSTMWSTCTGTAVTDQFSSARDLGRSEMQDFLRNAEKCENLGSYRQLPDSSVIWTKSKLVRGRVGREPACFVG